MLKIINCDKLQKFGKLKHLWVVFTNEWRKKNREIASRIGRAKKVLREFSGHKTGDEGEKTGAFNHRKAFRFEFSLCSDPTWQGWPNLLYV